MAKKKMSFAKGLAIVSVILLIGALILWKTNILQVKQEDGFIKVGLYGQDGKPLSNANTLSVVNTVPGVYFIDLTVTVQNTGQQALSCSLITLSPTAFNDATSKTVKAVPAGGKAAWTSTQMATSLFESPTPTNFQATVRCTYNSGTQVITLPDKTGSIVLDIEAEAGGAGFDVTVDEGSTPTEYCGDGTCQSSESTSTCPADCAVSSTVKFRTTSTSYVSGSAVGFTSACGSNLVGYGYVSSQTSSAYTCDATSGMVTKGSQCGANPVKVVAAIPGGFAQFPAGTASVWQGSDATKICVCQTESDGAGYKFVYYTTTDADASLVDTSKNAIDGAKEVAC